MHRSLDAQLSVRRFDGADEIRRRLEERHARRRGRLYEVSYRAGAGLFVVVVVGLIANVVGGSWQAISQWGPGVFWSGVWNPANDQFGAGLLLVGTVVTTLVAMAIVVPVGVATSLYLSEYAPRGVAPVLASTIEIVASMPSIVVGLWALLILSPIFARWIEPFLMHLPVLGGIFHGPAYGPSILLAAVVLAIMTLPTMVATCRGAFFGIALSHREAGLALGATRWQVVRHVVLSGSMAALRGAIILAVGRALGESVAVAMVIGDRPSIPHSLISPGATLGSAIVNQFAEATPGIGTSSVIALGAVLLLVTALVNVAGSASTVWRRRRRSIDPEADLGFDTQLDGVVEIDATSYEGSASTTSGAQISLRQVEIRATAASTIRRRRIAGRILGALTGVGTLLGLIPLVAVIFYCVERGLTGLSLQLITHAPTPIGIAGGGISTALSGTAELVGGAVLCALPLGLLVAIFVHERGGVISQMINHLCGVLAGVPSIIVGIFAYEIVVRPLHRFTLLAASFALAILMLPIMVKADREAIDAVAEELWEAGLSLGARRSRVLRSVVLRSSLPALVSGNLLAVARVVGETAPLLFTVGVPTFAMTMLIFSDATEPYPLAQAEAWSTALILLGTVLTLSVVARGVSWHLSRVGRATLQLGGTP